MKQGKSRKVNSSSIIWHPAFFEAIKLELDDYKDVLEFRSEYQLSTEPLRIDCVIIKKAKNVVIKKNIAAIFRETNILEYKSPDDYVSVSDFYKVYGYACLYASFEKIPITSLTISFLESRYPKMLIEHLKVVREYTVEENSSGIYTVFGDIIPIQIIDTRELSAYENLWLKDLYHKLDQNAIKCFLDEVSKHGKTARIRAYLDVVIRANQDSLRGALKMSNTQLTLDEIFEEAGLVAKWEARGEAKGKAIGEERGQAMGEERKAVDVAIKLIQLGIPFETIVTATGLDPEKVKSLYQSQ